MVRWKLSAKAEIELPIVIAVFTTIPNSPDQVLKLIFNFGLGRTFVVGSAVHDPVFPHRNWIKPCRVPKTSPLLTSTVSSARVSGSKVLWLIRLVTSKERPLVEYPRPSKAAKGRFACAG